MTASSTAVLARTRPRHRVHEPFAGLGRHQALGLVVPVLVISLWETLAREAIVPANWVPAPTTIAATLRDLWMTGDLAVHVEATLVRVASGMALGATLGTAIGLVTGQSTTMHRLLDPTLQALRNIPSMAWAPLFLLWMGIGEISKVTLIAVGVFFPVYLNLVSGIANIDHKLVEVGLLYRLNHQQFARRILLPAALPAYLVGLRSGLGLGWMFVVAAEIMGASRGLGYLMVDGQTTSRPELVISSILLFAILGKLSDAGLELLGRRCLRWKAA